MSLRRSIGSPDSTYATHLIQEPFTTVYAAEAAKKSFAIEMGAYFHRYFRWVDMDGYEIWNNGLDLLGAGYTWAQIGSTDEWYVSPAPATVRPAYLEIEGALGTKGTLASLSAGEWTFDDPGTGTNTIIVHHTDNPKTGSPALTSCRMTRFTFACKARTSIDAAAVAFSFIEGAGVDSGDFSKQDKGFFALSMSATGTSSLTAGTYFYDIEATLTNPSDPESGIIQDTIRLMQGRFEVLGEVTR